VKQAVLDKLTTYEGQILQLESDLTAAREQAESGGGKNENVTTRERSYKIDSNSPVYHGRVDENLDEWITIMNYNCMAAGVPDNMKLYSVANYLKDSARSELMAYQRSTPKEERSFLEFCKRLIKRDDPDIRSNKAKAKLERLRQVDSFDDYLNEFRSISLDTDWPDSELLRRFKEGLRKHTRMHVVSQNPKSLNDAINLACLLEQSMRSFEENRDEEVNFSKSRRNTTLRGACYNCGETGHLKKDCKNPTKCNRCHKRGHMASDCRVNLDARVNYVEDTEESEDEKYDQKEKDRDHKRHFAKREGVANSGRY